VWVRLPLIHGDPGEKAKWREQERVWASLVDEKCVHWARSHESANRSIERHHPQWLAAGGADVDDLDILGKRVAAHAQGDDPNMLDIGPSRQYLQPANRRREHDIIEVDRLTDEDDIQAGCQGSRLPSSSSTAKMSGRSAS
jgi:hypothetical protein